MPDQDDSADARTPDPIGEGWCPAVGRRWTAAYPWSRPRRLSGAWAATPRENACRVALRQADDRGRQRQPAVALPGPAAFAMPTLPSPFSG